MSDEQFDELGDRLSQAFSQQADRFEPSHDAYAKVAEAVAGRQKPSRVIGWFRPVAVAAVVLGVVAVGGIVISAQGSQSVDTGPADGGLADSGIVQDDESSAEDQIPTTVPGISADTIEGPDEDQAETTLAPADEAEPQTNVEVTGPVAATPILAGEAFLELLRMPNGSVVESGGRIIVRSHAEGGIPDPAGRIAAELLVEEVPGGFAVIEAVSDDVVIDEADTSMEVDGVTVSGSGAGFEGVLDVTLMSALDNRVVATSFPTAGNFGEPQPFVVDVSVTGSEYLWVVVAGSGAANAVTEPFAARLITYESTVADQTDYSVVRIGPDDADGGLVVRSGPGTGNERLGVIPSGTGGVRRTTELPVMVGDAAWWSVTTADGLQGWVHSRFLANSEPASTESLESTARRFAELAGIGDEVALQSLPFTRRAPVLVGTLEAPFELEADRLFLAETWQDPDLSEFYSVRDWWPSGEIQAGGQYSYDSDRQVAETNFGNLSSIVLAAENTDSTGGRTFLFVEVTPGGLEVVAMLVEAQQP